MTKNEKLEIIDALEQTTHILFSNLKAELTDDVLLYGYFGRTLKDIANRVLSVEKS